MRRMSIVFLTTLVASSVAVADPRDGGSAKEEKAALTATMRLNFGALMTLQPYLASPTRFADATHASDIRQQLDILQRTPHVFPGKSSTQEPGMAAVIHLFGGYLTNVRRRFDRGQTEYARSQLLTVTGFCFACHSRVGAEQDFSDLGKQVSTLGVSELEQADLYAATRQFESALRIYGHILRGKVRGEQGYFRWTDAARSALRITVRVKNDPDVTAKLLAPLEARTDLPPYLQEYLSGWRRDVNDWKADPTDPKKLSPDELVAKARDLIGAVDGLLTYELPDIPLLRATQYLHESLTRAPTGKHRSEALFLLGLAYSGPQDPLLWELDGLYFEACIRENPRTEIARRCFKRLQNEVYFGFTGSAGTHVPADELERLASLRKLAF